jgi:hypothetical protein
MSRTRHSLYGAPFAFSSLLLVACVSGNNNPPPGSPNEDAAAPDGGPSPGADGGTDSGTDATLTDAASDAAPGADASDSGPADAGELSDASCADAGTGRCLLVLATNQGNPEGLVLHGGYLYWIEEGLPQHIHRVLLPGGAVEDLGAAKVASSALAVDGTSMYWMDQYHGAIYSAPNDGIPDGGSPTLLAAVDGGGVTSMIIDSSRVYWTDYNAGKVYAAPLSGITDGGSPTLLAAPGGTPNGLATDGTNLYWTNTTASAIQAVSLSDGGGPVTLASGVSAPSEIAVANGTIYFASASANDVYSFPSTVMTDGGTPPIFVATGPTTTTSFFYDGANVYWTTSGNPGGEVVYAPPDGSPTTLALGMTSPGAIQVDVNDVYWSNFAYGAVFMMAK